MQITAMNFTGIYGEGEPDFRRLSGVDGYCSEEAKEAIRAKLHSYSPKGVHLLDSGNYHYASLFWLEKIQEPFTLVMFDHHTDMQPPGLLPLTSCGGWLLEAIQTNSMLEKVYLIGPPQDSYDEVEAEWKAKVFYLNEEDANHPEEREHLISKTISGPLFFSVDKDVLSEQALETNWDQGSMSLGALVEWIRFFAGKADVIGMDLCGEPGRDASGIFREEELLHSAEVNRALIAALEEIAD